MSTDRIDAEELLSSTNIVDIVEKHVELKKKGNEYIGICPFHDDTTSSLSVNEKKQIYKCFACGKGGDSINFLMELGMKFHEAAKVLSGEVASYQVPNTKRKLPKKQPEVIWTQLLPINIPVEINHYIHGKPSRVWEYHTVDGVLMGYYCRFDLEDGSKEVLPYIFATDGNRSQWRWQGFDKPRPLYRLNKILENPEATVIVVEGEKTADAAQLLFPKAIVTTWQGGGKAIQHTNFLPLEGRKVILWPDNDKPGREAVAQIGKIIKGYVAVLKYVKNPKGTPKAWDLADAEGWTVESAKAYTNANLMDEPEIDKVPDEESVENDPPPMPPPMEVFDDLEDVNTEAIHFRFLGFTNHGGSLSHNFFGHASKTVISLSPSAMSKNNLLELAPLNWWEQNFPGNRKGINTDGAADWLIHNSLQKGVFSDRYLRGRGAWIDKNNVVIHTGENLIVNGTNIDMRDFSSRFIYEFSEPLGFNIHDPLGTKESSKLIDILELLNWDREINSYLLAGWCIVAPICGALNWRPHIWLTGAAGTGKSWLFKNIVRKLMGETGLAVQGETSEAGLRQMLGHDALPVIFDEAEGEDRRAQERMQSVMALMRAASADDGGIMAKGTSSGTAKTYRIRSCFAFASIAVQLHQQSDRTRVTVLGLKKATDANKDARWTELNRIYQETITDDFARRLQARTVGLLPTIIANARTFASAAAAELGEQRVGDQLGALLAGAYSLRSTKIIEFDDAITWIRTKDWQEERGLDRTRDEIALLQYLLDQTVKVESNTGAIERSISELCSFASTRETDIYLNSAQAHDKLKRIGIKVELKGISWGPEDQLVISNSSDWIKRVLKETPWSKNHNKILQRIEGAFSIDSTRFGPGMMTRATSIPMAPIFDVK